MNNSNYLSFTLPIFQSSGKTFVHNEFRARFPPCGGAAQDDDDDDTGKVRYGPALQLVCNSPFSRGLIFMCFCRLHVLLAAGMGIFLVAAAAAAAAVENKEPSRRSQKREENPSGDRIAFCAF